jgi:hypothetical protein
MKANTQWMVAALAALTAMSIHTIHAQATIPVSMAYDGDAAGANGFKTYADWQGPLTPSLGFLARRTSWDRIAGGPPSRSFTLPIFGGLEKIHVWRDVR